MRRIGKGDALRDRYELEVPLGHGAMGQVWRGRDRHLGRRVAVKLAVLSPGTGDMARARKRFEREAKAAAALDSANVATVHDAGVDFGDDGEIHWLVMQLVEGATLGELLGERIVFDLASAAAVAAQMCAGLAPAHAAGLVHRDLKPENVMVRRDGVVKVLDFGLVKLMSEAGPRLTATGETIGNLMYASPELLEGAVELDARSDLYSVGCLLHGMLAGAPPFASKVPMEVFGGHLTQEPPSLASAGVTVPDALQELVSALLAKRRQDRPGSAAEVYQALGPWLPKPGNAEGGERCGSEDPRRPFLLPQAPFPL
ncbi:serine/threonine-protein kinase [Streptomyces sp. MST-110588]|uniref:serine/threonine-protein kinase n=1 Tax=Streptomyces sp. MST-110588 TaxID=2833628 RepID=UPI001F5D8E73|nr:serine/threonine-protein kinase [Streptomyces sp. MST-110588]